MARTPDLNTRAVIRRLARRVRRLEAAAVDNARGEQAAHRSVHEGRVTVYDDTDTERLRFGRQDTGGYGVRHVNGPKPEAPSVPLVSKVYGGVTITWDGYDLNDEIGWDEDELSHVNVHNMTDPEDEPDTDNLIGTIVSLAGGAITVSQPSDVNTTAVLVAVSRAGRESDPSAGADVDGGGKLPQWEDDDRYVLTDYDVIDGAAEFDLSHVPLPESVDLRWLTVPQKPGEDFTYDQLGTVTFPLEGHEKPGQVIWPHYQWLNERPPDEPTALTWVGSNYTPTTESTQLEAPLPGGTQRHDLVALMMFGGYGDGAAYSMDDPRFEPVFTGTQGGRPIGVYVTRIGSDRSPAAINIRGGSNAYGQFAWAATFAFRGATGRPNWQPGRTAQSGPFAGGAGAMPELAGGGTGAIAFVFASGSTGGAFPVNLPAPWVERAEFADYNVGSIGTRLDADAVPSVGPPITDPDDSWRCFLIGVT